MLVLELGNHCGGVFRNVESVNQASNKHEGLTRGSEESL